MSGLRVAVVGATGAVGTVMLRLLRERAFPAIRDRRRSPPSARSAASSTAASSSRRWTTRRSRASTSRCSPPGATRSREWAQRFVDAGAVVVDNSSAFRRDPAVPLVVSEVNPAALERHNGIVANPNCTTMVAMLPLKALHDAFNLRAMVATSFQAAGGAGQKGIDELAAQIAPLAADVAAALRRRRRGRRARSSTRCMPRRSRSTSCRSSARSARRATPTRSSSCATSRARSSGSPTSRSRRRACACR